MTIRSLPALALAAVFGAGAAHAQLAASLRMTKKMHLAGEPVIAVVTITNHAGKELVFRSDGRFQWLGLTVKDGNGNNVGIRGNKLFGPMKIAAGQTLAREVDLTEYFQLTQPGNFSVSAVINEPGKATQGTPTNRAFFIQSQGSTYWSQKVGLAGGRSGSREFRLINFTGDSKSHLYAQVRDGTTGQFVRTFMLGDVLMLRKPLATVDRQQRMHVLFLTTPSHYVHCVVGTDGNLVARQIHQRGPVGDPQLLTFGDGTVRVTNSIPYDAKAAAEQKAKVRKATDRPSITF
jgi:hypothetical protein